MTDVDALSAAVARVLERAVPEAFADGAVHELELTPLHGGLARRTYLASLGPHRWAVRRGHPPPGTIDLRSEAELTAEAAEALVAPELVAWDASAGLLITEYRAGATPIGRSGLSRPENAPRVAALLRRLHAIRRALRRFDPECLAAQYLRAIQRRASDAQRRLAGELRALARDYRLRHPAVALCHNDLIASNILDDGRLWLIDFEYAVTAAPVLDLAGLAAMNDLGERERWRLAEAYYAGGAAVPFTPAELDKVVRLVRLIGYFWALSSACVSPEGGPYRRFAERLERMLCEPAVPSDVGGER